MGMGDWQAAAQPQDTDCRSVACVAARQLLGDAQLQVGRLLMQLEKLRAERSALMSAWAQAEGSVAACSSNQPTAPSMLAQPQTQTKGSATDGSSEQPAAASRPQTRGSAHARPLPLEFVANQVLKEPGSNTRGSTQATQKHKLVAANSDSDGPGVGHRSNSDHHMVLHYRKDEAEKQSCRQCLASFKTYKQLDQHTATEHPGTAAHRCLQCDRTFPAIRGLLTHARWVHNPKEYHCGICNLRFSRKHNMLAHQENHTNNNDWSVQSNNIKHSCRICGQGFSNPSNLKQHITTHANGQPLKCSKCNKCFLSASQLQLHRQAHVLHRCAECGKRFQSSALLGQHRAKTHNQQSVPRQKPFECLFCSRRFAYQGTYRNHMQFSLCSGAAAMVGLGTGRGSDTGPGSGGVAQSRAPIRGGLAETPNGAETGEATNTDHD